MSDNGTTVSISFASLAVAGIIIAMMAFGYHCDGCDITKDKGYAGEPKYYE